MNLLTTIACLLALSATVKASGLLGGPVYAPGHASLDYYAYPTYAFEYAVRDPHTGDNKAQWEKRDGDVVVGAYSLVEPDGSIRVVEYKADDKSGFNAVVKRIGPNLHPVAPIYKAPIPILGEKLISPLSIGPVAGLKGLASAPLLTTQLLGGNIYGGKIPSLLKDLGPVAPITSILPAPVIKEPIISEPYYGPNLIKEPILSRPLLYNPNPIKGPIVSGISPYGSIPIKEPILPGLLPYGPNLIKGQSLSGLLPYGPNLIKEPILSGPLPYGPLPLLNKEPYLQSPLLNPSYSILKEPIGIPLLGKWSSSGRLDESLGNGLLNRPNNGWH